MNKTVRNALNLLENSGYSIKKQINESETNIVDDIMNLYNEYEKNRNTVEGDDIWEELTSKYDNDLIDIVVNQYDEIKNNEVIDMTDYLAPADNLYGDFFILMRQLGKKKFVVDAERAFQGKTKYFLEATMKPVKYELLEKPEGVKYSYPILFTIDDDANRYY